MQQHKLPVAGEAVLAQLVLLALVLVAVIGQAAHNGEQHRGVAVPVGRVGGPDVFQRAIGQIRAHEAAQLGSRAG